MRGVVDRERSGGRADGRVLDHAVREREHPGCASGAGAGKAVGGQVLEGRERAVVRGGLRQGPDAVDRTVRRAPAGAARAALLGDLGAVGEGVRPRYGQAAGRIVALRAFSEPRGGATYGAAAAHAWRGARPRQAGLNSVSTARTCRAARAARGHYGLQLVPGEHRARRPPGRLLTQPRRRPLRRVAPVGEVRAVVGGVEPGAGGCPTRARPATIQPRPYAESYRASELRAPGPASGQPPRRADGRQVPGGATRPVPRPVRPPGRGTRARRPARGRPDQRRTCATRASRSEAPRGPTTEVPGRSAGPGRAPLRRGRDRHSVDPCWERSQNGRRPVRRAEGFHGPGDLLPPGRSNRV